MDFVPIPLARTYEKYLADCIQIITDQAKRRLLNIYPSTVNFLSVICSQKSSLVGHERLCVYLEALVSPSHPQQEVAAAVAVGWAPGEAASAA